MSTLARFLAYRLSTRVQKNPASSTHSRRHQHSALSPLRARVGRSTSSVIHRRPPEVADFVSRYTPAYAMYTPALYEAAAECGGGVDGKPTLRIDVDASRSPVA